MKTKQNYTMTLKQRCSFYYEFSYQRKVIKTQKDDCEMCFSAFLCKKSVNIWAHLKIFNNLLCSWLPENVAIVAILFNFCFFSTGFFRISLTHPFTHYYLLVYASQPTTHVTGLGREPANKISDYFLKFFIIVYIIVLLGFYFILFELFCDFCYSIEGDVSI